MANMHYCRFQNTRNDLDECLDSLRDEEELSDDEARAGKRMLENVFDFFVEVGIIEDEYEAKERLDDYINEIMERSE